MGWQLGERIAVNPLNGLWALNAEERKEWLEQLAYENIEYLRELSGADQDQLDALERHLDNEAFGSKGWIP